VDDSSSSTGGVSESPTQRAEEADSSPSRCSPGPLRKGRTLVDMERAQLAGTDWKIANYTITSDGATKTVHKGGLVAEISTWAILTDGDYEATKGEESPSTTEWSAFAG